MIPRFLLGLSSAVGLVIYTGVLVIWLLMVNTVRAVPKLPDDLILLIPYVYLLFCFLSCFTLLSYRGLIALGIPIHITGALFVALLYRAETPDVNPNPNRLFTLWAISYLILTSLWIIRTLKIKQTEPVRSPNLASLGG